MVIHEYLNIELLSDMCCGTGEGNGSSIDTCTAFDEVGLPLIPGKRLKGLLRDNGILICKYDESRRNAHELLFGSPGGKEGCLRVDNAVLSTGGTTYETLQKELHSSYARPLRDEISRVFTTSRTQTKIGGSGTAADTSLRTTQVVRAGLRFSADLYIDCAKLGSNGTAVVRMLKDCVSLLRHIGLNKSRGFGEVSCKLEQAGKAPEGVPLSTLPASLSQPITKSYNVSLVDDLVFSGGSNASVDYISSGVLQGAFARLLEEHKSFIGTFLKTVEFSNAYINDAAPMPLSVVIEKNSGEHCFNLADGYKRDSEKQYVPLTGYYSLKHQGEEGVLVRHTVRCATEYHVSLRSPDGGIRDPGLFTFRKILKGQVFSGVVTAPPEALEVLQVLLKNNHNRLRLGGSTSAQYATCKVKIGDDVQADEIISTDNMIVELTSDTVVRDEFNATSGNIRHLINALRKIVEFDDCEAFCKTTTTGGFNRTWKLPLQQQTAFAKGSVIVLHSCLPHKPLKKHGSLQSIEGCFGCKGSYTIRPQQETCVRAVRACGEVHDAQSEQAVSPDTAEVLKQIIRNRLVERYKAQARRHADGSMTTNLSQSAAMRTLAALRSSKGRSDFKTYVERNFSGSNTALHDFTRSAIGQFEAEFEKQDDPLEQHNDASGLETPPSYWALWNTVKQENADALFMEYMRAYLAQTKHNYRITKRGGA